jgi:hypothetical protein
MALIVLVGSDTALLEGLAQSLAAVGHRSHLVSSMAEAVELSVEQMPLVALVERELVASDADALQLQLVQGGALMVYRPTHAAPTPLSPVLQRAVMADLELPLERHRLIALVQRVDERVRATGRNRRNTPPESRAQ